MSTRAGRPNQDRLFELPAAPGETPKLFSFDQLLELASDPDPELSVGGSGLFPPELTLGPGNLKPADEAALCAHLIAVARSRRIPLHPAIAWNALYFGYQPESGGYDMATIRDSDLVQLVSHARADAMPVGALVTFHSEEGEAHDEWAEIVYKEGRPAAALDGPYVVARYSGAVDVVSAPSEVASEQEHSEEEHGEETVGEAPAVTELLVLDFSPFAQLDAHGRSWLEHTRARRDRHALDAAGHVLVDAVYPESSGLSSDVEYFSEWMLSTHRASLAEGWLGAALDEPSDEALSEAMWNSLLAVESVLERSEAFEEWAGYWYLREDLEAFAADGEHPGSSADAGYLLSTVASVPRGDRVAYHPLAPALENLLGPEQLRYEHYARHIIYVNVLMARALTERCDEGVLAKAGSNFGVRLDDGWLYGGTWRAELIAADSICPLIGFDPTITLGLGATGELDDRHIEIEVVQPDEETEPEVAPEVAPDTALEETEDEAPDEPAPELGEPFTWSAVVRESHRQDQRIWVHPDANLVAHQGHIVLRLTHLGEIDDAERVQKVSLSPNGAWLYGVRFPLDFFTGIRLTCMAQRGGSVVFAGTEALPNEISVAGTDYGFAFDRHTIDPAAPRTREPRLFDRAVRAIDRYGEDMENRWHRLDAASISDLIFGPEAGSVGENAVTAELRSEPTLVRLDDSGMWWHQALVAGRRLFARPGPSGGIFAGASDALRRAVHEAGSRHYREHRVILHLRRLQVSERASPEREMAYAILREHAPNRARLPGTLPEGYTFVVSHVRGGRHDRE